MDQKSAIRVLGDLSAPTNGAFRGRDALDQKVSRKQLGSFAASGVIERVLPDTYRLTAVAACHQQSLRCALLWAGEEAAGWRRSAGVVYGFEGVRADTPEIVGPRRLRARAPNVVVHPWRCART